MTNVESMTVRKTGDDLTENTNSFMLWKLTMCRDVFEQLTSFNILEYEIAGFR